MSDIITKQESIREILKNHYNISQDSSKILVVLMKFRQIKRKDLISQLNTFYPKEKLWKHYDLSTPIEQLKNNDLILQEDNYLDIINLDKILEEIHDISKFNLELLDNNKADLIAEWEKAKDKNKVSFILTFKDIGELSRDIEKCLPGSIIFVGKNEVYDNIIKTRISEYYLNKTELKFIKKNDTNLSIVFLKDVRKEKNHIYIIFNENMWEVNSEVGLRINNPDLFKMFQNITK